MSETKILMDGRDMIYSSLDEGYPAVELKVERDVKDAGAAEITLPPTSLAIDYGGYDALKPYKSLIEILRGDEILFRGRLISKKRDFWKRAKLTCEGELAFFKDSTIREHTYTGAPATLFAAVVTEHNSQIDTWKRFAVGTVTVTTTETSPALELDKAVSAADALAKLREKYGGYFKFRTRGGARYIDWAADLTSESSQNIEFGSNLLDLAVTTTNNNYANRIVPYGKRIDDAYVTLSGRVDYVEDAAAQAVYGIVSRAVYYNDVEDSATLLIRANADLAERSKMISTLTVSALDLKELAGVPQVSFAGDGLDVGMLVRVKSAPHGINALYLVTHRTYDLLDPKNSKITLGGSPVTLTGQLAAIGGII